MNSFAFSQLNVLTPSPGVSPTNGPEQDRSDLTLSFPCDGSALQAQLEAWTNTTFNFDDFGPVDFHDKEEGLQQHQQQQPAFGFDESVVDLESLLAPSSLGPAAFDPFHDYNPSTTTHVEPPSLVDPALHLPLDFNNAVPAAPAPTPKPIKKATKSKKAKTVAATPLAAVTVAPSTPASEASDSPGPALILDGDDAANALAIEEDKRRRNTAASARFRIKKKQREAALEQTAKELRDRVAALEGEVEALRTENGWLRGLITEKPVKGGTESTIDPSLAAELPAFAGRKRSRIEVDEDGELLV